MAIEINSSDDNPLFDTGLGRVQSGGDFYGSHIAQGMDSLKIALANLCVLLDRQLELVVDEKFNVGLTPNLIAEHVAAIHLLALCQALDLRGIAQASPAARTAHALVREHVPFLVVDRRMDGDIAVVVELIRASPFSCALDF